MTAKQGLPSTRESPSYKGLVPSSEAASAAARASSRKTDTRCEVKIRSLLWRAGARFRKNVKTLPGKPDIVFPAAHLAIFCDGDFWHGKETRPASPPRSCVPLTKVADWRK